MRPAQAAIPAVLALMMGAALVHAAEPADDSGKPLSPDEIAIYDAVLASWLDGSTQTQQVAQALGPAPSRNDPALKSCGKGLIFDTPGGGASLAGAALRTRKVELVDGARWSARDPGEAIARGTSVDAAVKAGFDHSLMSLSRIVFTADRRDALVAAGMSCGSLCGSGSTIRLHKVGGRWSIAERCSSWVS